MQSMLYQFATFLPASQYYELWDEWQDIKRHREYYKYDSSSIMGEVLNPKGLGLKRRIKTC